MKNESNGLVGIVSDYLRDSGWDYDFDEEESVFSFGWCIGDEPKIIDVRVWVRESSILTYAGSPRQADPKDAATMVKLAEFISRANSGLMNGNFEMNHYNGDLCFKSYIDAAGGQVSQEVIRNSIFNAARMIEIHEKGISGVLDGTMDPEEAVDECANVFNSDFFDLLERKRKNLEALLQALKQDDDEDPVEDDDLSDLVGPDDFDCYDGIGLDRFFLSDTEDDSLPAPSYAIKKNLFEEEDE